MIFLPFRIGIDCPSCGTLVPENTELEYLNFINVCSENMKQNMVQNGTYQASAWYVGNYSDWMQSNIFDICELIRTNKPHNILSFLSERLSEFDWDKPTVKHTIEITLVVYPSLSFETKISLFNKIKQSLLRRVRSFLP
jgi:hypothetical protein